MKILITPFAITMLASLGVSAQTYWQPLKEGQWPDYGIHSLHVDEAADLLYFGGNFKYIKNADDENILLLNGIGMWNGTEYGSMAVSDEDCPTGGSHPIRDITKYNNKIIVGTGCEYVGNLQVNGIASWDGMEWEALGNGIEGSVSSLLVLNDELIVGGSLTNIAGVPASLGKWNGQEWVVIPFPQNLDGGTPLITGMAFHNNELYIGGLFSYIIGGETYSNIIKYDGINWHPVYGGIRGSSYLTSMTIFQDQLYVAGAFIQAAGNAGNNIMRLGATGWEDVHGGVWGENIYQVHALHVHHDALYVSGSFEMVGDGVVARNIARWDGEKWCALGGGALNYMILDMETFRDTLIVAAGATLANGDIIKNISKWTGGDYVENCGLPVATNTLPLDSSIKLSPNPASDQAQLQLGGFHAPVQVRIFDALGRVMYERQATASQLETLQIPVRDWPQGIYQVQIQSGGKTLTRQVVVQR